MITALGPLGTNSAYVQGTSNRRPLTISPSSSVPAGNLVVVWYANHSVFSIFSPSNGYNFWRCRDSQGNLYSTIGAETDTSGFSKTGAACIMFICQLKTGLSTSDTITVETINNFFASEFWAQAMSVEEFSLSSGNRWAVGDQDWSRVRSFEGSDPPSISHSIAGPDREVLYLHGLGARGPNTDTYTWDSDYTEIVGAGTTGGSHTENIYIRGGYRIDTLSGNSDTVDVTANGTPRNTSQIMNIVCEVPAKNDFPVSPILDNFNRADENPLNNGTWDTTNMAFGSAFAKIVSNEAAGAGGSWWLDPMESCAEVYATWTTIDDGVHLHFFGAGNSDTATMNGRGSAWLIDGHPAGTPGPLVSFGQSGNQGRVGNLRFVTWVDAAADDKLGMQRAATTQGSTFRADHLWVDVDGSWEETGAIFLPISGSNLFSGKLALAFDANGDRADDFGGGEFPCITSRPQIMRYK